MADDTYRSRTARRSAERDRLTERVRLLDALAALPVEERALLPADDDLRDAIEQLAGMKADGARSRLIRHLARRTPDGAWPPLEGVLARVEDASVEATALEHAATEWRARLLDEGDTGVDAFVEAHPTADRGRLRQLVRNAGKGEGPASKRARRLLLRAIRPRLLEAAGAAPDAAEIDEDE